MFSYSAPSYIQDWQPEGQHEHTNGSLKTILKDLQDQVAKLRSENERLLIQDKQLKMENEALKSTLGKLRSEVQKQVKSSFILFYFFVKKSHHEF
jgi:regulator of replication initiation timing